MIPLPPMAVEREFVTFIVNPESPPGNPHFWSPRMTWETDTYAALARYLHPGMVFVDVGAWVGPFAIWAAVLGADVLALEPDPVAHAQLLRNMRLNPEARRILPFLAAAGPDWGVVDLYARELGNSQTSARYRKGHRLTVPQRSIDSLGAYMAAPPDVIKIDVEGMEAQVLAGAMETLVEHRPTLVLSIHPGYLYGADWAIIDRVARIYGHPTIDRHDPGPHVLHPRGSDME